jgi:integrase
MPIYAKKGRGADAWRVVIRARGKTAEFLFRGKKTEAKDFEATKRIECERAWAAEQEAPTANRAVPTLASFVHDSYWPHAKAHLRPKTVEVRRYQLNNLATHIGTLKLTEIGTAAVDRFKAARLEEVQASTVNTELTKLQAVLTYARSLGVPCASPTIKLLPQMGRRRVTWWSEAEVAALLGAVERVAPHLFGIVIFLANTGCRPGEALALERRCIDLARGMILIEPNEEWQPKDNEPREIPITGPLRPWLASISSPRWAFPSETGERWACWPKLAFNRARAAAGHADACPRWKGETKCTCGAKGLTGGPYTLRHTFASHFLKNKPDMFLLAQLMGHSHTRVTKLYAHLLPDHLEAARDVVSFAAPIGPARLESRKRWRATG